MIVVYGVIVRGRHTDISKTLQGAKSALSSINIRRLLIAVKKYIASSTRLSHSLYFSPCDCLRRVISFYCLIYLFIAST